MDAVKSILPTLILDSVVSMVDQVSDLVLIITWYSTVDLNQYNLSSQKGNLTRHKDAINLTSTEYLLKQDSAPPMRRLLGIV